MKLGTNLLSVAVMGTAALGLALPASAVSITAEGVPVTEDFSGYDGTAIPAGWTGTDGGGGGLAIFTNNSAGGFLYLDGPEDDATLTINSNAYWAFKESESSTATAWGMKAGGITTLNMSWSLTNDTGDDISLLNIA